MSLLAFGGIGGPARRREATLKDISSIDPMIDDIGAMIDEAVARPEAAEAIKARILERLSRRTIQPMPPEPEASDDPDDFWENVPI